MLVRLKPCPPQNAVVHPLQGGPIVNRVEKRVRNARVSILYTCTLIWLHYSVLWYWAVVYQCYSGQGCGSDQDQISITSMIADGERQCCNGSFSSWTETNSGACNVCPTPGKLWVLHYSIHKDAWCRLAGFLCSSQHWPAILQALSHTVALRHSGGTWGDEVTCSTWRFID